MSVIKTFQLRVPKSLNVDSTMYLLCDLDQVSLPYFPHLRNLNNNLSFLMEYYEDDTR